MQSTRARCSVFEQYLVFVDGHDPSQPPEYSQLVFGPALLNFSTSVLTSGSIMSVLGPPQHAAVIHSSRRLWKIHHDRAQRFRPCFDAPRPRALAQISHQLSLGLVDVIPLVECRLPRY